MELLIKKQRESVDQAIFSLHVETPMFMTTPTLGC